MKSGSATVLFFDKIVPDLKGEYFDPKFIPDHIFTPSIFEKKENYKKIVQPDEDVDNFGNKGHFEMDDKFRLVVLSYADPDDDDHKQSLNDRTPTDQFMFFKIVS